ncbi:hypothetical protein [uncultured Hoeflea sp.]|uniref:hypothetical protein n=1 Tax=uncultured Hoeflea sp. TaxID=538666 RepID=UPI0030EC17C8
MKSRQDEQCAENGSMAVWCVAAGEIAETSIETHFNFWRIAGDEAFKGKEPDNPAKDFLEIGVLVTNPKPLQKICFYLPVKVGKNDIDDAGARLANTSVAQGIFNEQLNCVTTPAPERIELRTGDKLFCKVHKFIINGGTIDAAHMGVTEFADGTLVTIEKDALDSVCVDLNDGERVYFRIRVYLQNGKDSPFIRVITPADWRFQSGFEEIAYIDFRLNELRTLPARVENRMRADEAERKVPISLVAFLTAFPVHSNVSSSSAQSHKNRLLENNPWSEYVASGIPRGMVVYHWKKIGKDGMGVSDFSSFVKLHTRRSGRKIVLTYLAVAFLFGLIGNLTANWFTSYFQGESNTEQNLVVGEEAPKEP